MGSRLGLALAIIAAIITFIFIQSDANESKPLPVDEKNGSTGLEQVALFPPLARAATRSALSGKKLYTRRCGACHSIDQNRVGPRHRGVFGRKAGSVSGFRYSKALKNLNIRWNEKNLDRWLTNPTAMVPGTSMGFRLNKPDERRAIINYLKSVSD
ncbi:c-type cytochrome [Parasphingorhabdus sp. JC815]|uniref:c-type cytochrome n=1 Tax=Parasphingorhabdus sp. JC815 TaxID=3232140 RepID=UPI003459EB1E